MWVGEIWRAAWFDMKLKKTFELLMKHWDLMRVFVFGVQMQMGWYLLESVGDGEKNTWNSRWTWSLTLHDIAAIHETIIPFKLRQADTQLSLTFARRFSTKKPVLLSEIATPTHHNSLGSWDVRRIMFEVWRHPRLQFANGGFWGPWHP